MTKKMTTSSLIILIVLVLLVVYLIHLSFEGKTELLVSKDDQMVMAVVLKALNSEHWSMVKQGAEDAAEKHGIELIVLAPENETMNAMQNQMITDLIHGNIDGIAIAPTDSEGVASVIDEATLWDIPVFLLDTQALSDEHVVSYIGTDNFLAGQLAGIRMVDILENQGNVAILAGSLEQKTHVDRVAGFMHMMDASDVNVHTIEVAMSDIDIAFEKTSDLISDGDLDAIFATNALMAIGAYEAIKDANASTQIIGFDIEKQLLTYIDEGHVDSTVSQDPYTMGYKTVESFYNYSSGLAVENRIITSSTIVNQVNLDYYMRAYKLKE